jgi:hypothetical protein
LIFTGLIFTGGSGSTMRRVPVRATSYINQWGTLVHRRAHRRRVPDSGANVPSHRSSSPPSTHQPPRSFENSPAQPVYRRHSKRRRLAIGITTTLAIGAGTATISISTSGNSGGGGNSVTVQATTSLGQAVSDLQKLGFAGSDSVQPTASGSNADCASSSSGDVRQFLTLHPCKEYAVTSIEMHKLGIATQAASSWVVMPSATLANQYMTLVGIRYSGNPPGESAAFNGLCYASAQSGETVWVGQVVPTGHVAADRQILQAIAPLSLSPDYLKAHCID